MAGQKTDKLLALQNQIDKLQARYDLEASRRKEAARKADTRRKIIVGALALEHMDKNPSSDFASVLLKLMDEYVTRPHERALFPALPDTTPPSEQPAG